MAAPLRLAAQENHDPNHHKHVRYSIKVLPTLGGTLGYAGGINIRGAVVANSTLRGDQEVHGFFGKTA